MVEGPSDERREEIGPGDLLALGRRRAGWIAGAAALGTALGTAYMIGCSSAGRDPLAGAAVGILVAMLVAGWLEWGHDR